MANHQEVGKAFSGTGCTGLSAQDLSAYRLALAEQRRSERRLEELCSAIEDFGLATGCAPDAAQAAVTCSDGVYTPGEILTAAGQEADRLEALTQAASEARGRVLAMILRHSRSLAEYRATRRLYVDLFDAALEE